MNLKEKREQAIKEMTQEAIRTAVLQVMDDFGLSGVTMARVAEEAGVAKGTLYLYYQNKQELMHKTINACFMPLIENAKEIFAMDLPPHKKLSRLIESHHSFFNKNQPLFKMLLVDHQAVRSENKKKENDHYKEIIESLSELIQEGIDKKIFKKINPKATAIILMESNLQWTYQLLEPENDLQLEPDGSASILKEIFFNGILKNE